MGPHIFPAKEDGSDPRLCPKCGTGRLSLKISGKSGAFIGCGNYPDCKYTRQLTGEATGAAATASSASIPTTGLPVAASRAGRFGPYLAARRGRRRREAEALVDPEGHRRRHHRLREGDAASSLPREVGIHPETGTPIMAGLGRYGPFIQHDGTYANVDSIEDVFTIGLNRAGDAAG